jgi:outer membrane protein assembly factor BamB
VGRKKPDEAVARFEFGHTVALDKATGEARWHVKTYGDGIATPAVITVGGTDILLGGDPAAEDPQAPLEGPPAGNAPEGLD